MTSNEDGDQFSLFDLEEILAILDEILAKLDAAEKFSAAAHINAARAVFDRFESRGDSHLV